MIGRLVDFSVRRRVLVALLAATITVVGAVQVRGSEVETLPEFLPPIVEVQTEALGLSATEVEQLITVPLEADLLNGVAWLEAIQSESMPGLSSIVMEFEEGTDVLRARQVVQERLTQAAGLPNVSRAPAMVQPLSSESRVMMIGMSSDELSLVDMSVLARWTVRPFLMGVTGVANVSVWGQRERQLQVLVDQQELVAADLDLLDVVKTTGNALWVSPLSYLEASSPGTGGFIDGPNQRIGVQHVLGIETPADLASIAIEGHDGLTLGDVTTVVEDHQPLIGDAVVDEGPGLLLVIEKFPWSNTAETTQAVEAALAELSPGLSGITVDTQLFRPADYIERSVDNLQLRAIISLMAVIAVAFLLLAGWRPALVALLSLLVSLVGAAVVLSLTGNEVNTMVFAGFAVALGLVIDDAIGTAAIARRRLAADHVDSGEVTLVHALSRSRSPIIYATVILAIAIVPVFVMEGPAGVFLPSIGVTALVTLVVSILVSLLVTPALCGLLMASHTQPEPSWLMVRASAGFDALRRSSTARPGRFALIGVVLLLAIGTAIVPSLERRYIPVFEQTDLLVRLDGAPGTSLEASRRTATAAAEEINALAGVDEVGAHVGRAVLSDEIVNVNSSELWVNINPDADFGGTVDSIRGIVSGYPGYGNPDAVTYSNTRIDEVLSESTDDLAVRVYGEDPIQLGQLADEMVSLIDGIDGTENVRAIHPVLEPTIEIEVDLERAAEFGVKPGDVRRTAATLLSGIEVGSFFEQQKVFEVVVWSSSDNRQSISNVADLLVDSPTAGRVALSEVADVRVAPAETVIVRDAVSRFIDVTADLSGRGFDAVSDDITDAVATRGLPYEYHVRVLDDQNEADENQSAVLIVALAVGFAILLLLQAAFGSWRLAALLFVTAPLGIVGGLGALMISGGTYSIGSSIGLFAAYGLTIRTSLALVDRYDALQLVDGLTFGPDLFEAGLRDRFGPTVISLAAVAAAMLPIVVLGTGAGLEIARPMAIVVLGGVVTAAFVSLFVVPAAYAAIGRPAIARESLISR